MSNHQHTTDTLNSEYKPYNGTPEYRIAHALEYLAHKMWQIDLKLNQIKNAVSRG